MEEWENRQRANPEEYPAEHARYRRRALRRSLGTAIGMIVFGTFLAVQAQGEPELLLLGGWIVTVGIIGLVAVPLRARIDRGDGPRGSVRVGRLTGRRTTVLRDHPVDELLAGALNASIAGLLGGLGLIALPNHRELASILIAGAALTLVPVLRSFVRRRVSGLWLGADELVQRADGEERAIRWADLRHVTEPDGAADLILVLPFERSQVRARRLWRRARRPRVPDDGFTITTVKSPFPPAELVAIIRHYAEPGRAAQKLGAPVAEEHLRRIAAEARGSATAWSTTTHQGGSRPRE